MALSLGSVSTQFVNLFIALKVIFYLLCENEVSYVKNSNMD